MQSTITLLWKRYQQKVPRKRLCKYGWRGTKEYERSDLKRDLLRRIQAVNAKTSDKIAQKYGHELSGEINYLLLTVS